MDIFFAVVQSRLLGNPRPCTWCFPVCRYSFPSARRQTVRVWVTLSDTLHTVWFADGLTDLWRALALEKREEFHWIPFRIISYESKLHLLVSICLFIIVFPHFEEINGHYVVMLMLYVICFIHIFLMLQVQCCSSLFSDFLHCKYVVKMPFK